MVSEEATPARYNRVLPQFKYLVKSRLSCLWACHPVALALVQFDLIATIYMNLSRALLGRARVGETLALGGPVPRHGGVRNSAAQSACCDLT